ncbi:MAG: pyridoxamine 5'-phosphate oxidase family protein [Bryobacteraceae bacterium]|nr:pyridoxamine 5'-phosphate oxidase family protein [Bryobacteraceae bacterium]MDW8376702.1 pyridoxamine 5'-phosphate oxidase family protein [Bryobacterales bacterium]
MKLPPAPQKEHLRELALAVVAADRFPMLATVDGDQPRVRPVSPVRTEGFTVYVASMRSSNKTAELERSPKVELCYLSKDHDQVRITGIAESIEDRGLRQEVWDANPLLRAYLKSVENPEFMLYRIRPTRVRYMREWALEYFDVDLES